MTGREWFTAAELADLSLPTLPGTERNIRARATREGWQHRERQGRGGGREFHISSLPSAAKAKLVMASAPASAPAGGPTKAQMSRTDAWRWYDGLPDKKKNTAEWRLSVLNAVLALYQHGVSKDVAVMQAARQHGVSASSIYNWFKLTDGVERADWLPALAP
ncbi:DNA-binding protein, partial [Roseospirillum parvum]